MTKPDPRDFNWTPEDRRVYTRWLRGILILWGCICVVAVAVLVLQPRGMKSEPSRQNADTAAILR
jgi:hypothetical protein